MFLQNKILIQELLKDLPKEQTKVGSEWKDDIDLRVDEMKACEVRGPRQYEETVLDRIRTTRPDGGAKMGTLCRSMSKVRQGGDQWCTKSRNKKRCFS